MDEREIARVYIAEMRALLPVLKRHLDALGGTPVADQRMAIAAEFGRLARAAADMSADFHAEDCATLAAALASAFPYSEAMPINRAVLAPAADALTYLHTRMVRMDAAHRILAPSEGERAAARRLLIMVHAASGQAPPGSVTDPLDFDLGPSDAHVGVSHSASATSELLAPEVPQWMPGAPERAERPLPPPVTAALSPDKLPFPLSDRSVEQSSPEHGTSPVASDPSGLPYGPETLVDLDQLASPPSASYGEPSRVPLSAEDLAILNAFKTGPLRRSTGPLSPDALARIGVHPHRTAPPEAANPGDGPELPPPPPPGGLEELGDLSADMREVLIFEVTGDLQEIQRLLVSFEQEPSNRALLQAIERIAHKMKGAAGTLDFPVLGELAHLYEEQLAIVRKQGAPADVAVLNHLLRGLAELEAALATIVAGRPEDPDAEARMRALSAALRAGATAADEPLPALPADDGPPSAPLTVVRADSTSGPLAADANTPSLTTPLRLVGPDSQMRVDVRRMDDLMRRVSALAVNRAELAQVRQAIADSQGELDHSVNRLTELSNRLVDLPPTRSRHPAASAGEHSASGQQTTGLIARMLRGKPHEPAAANGADRSAPELERYTEYDEMIRALTEATADVGASATALRSGLRRLDGLAQTQEGIAAAIQQAVMQVRLVPLSDHLPRLQRAVRSLAQQLGKSVVFSVQGELTEIDRDVSDALAETLTQLARNAVAHGIEPPEERRALGKPAVGNLWLRAYYAGNEVNLELGDDGRGINPDQVLASALLAGIVDPATAHTLSPEQALNLIFEQGVSTVEEATSAAGHGIGMAEVAETIGRLRGTVRIQSEIDKGTTIRIRVPISLSIVHALQIRVSGQGYAVPFAAVLQTMSVVPPPKSGERTPNLAEERHLWVEIGNQQVSVPVYVLADVLGVPYSSRPQETALVVEFGRERVALIADEIIAEGEVVVRSLPPHLSRRAIRGATITPPGEVVLLLDLPELAGRLLVDGHSTARRIAPPLPGPGIPSSRVLVVDDSLSIRRAVQGALTRAGFEVQLARDGIEALEQVLADPPRAIVLDIEMPRLDGYELLSALRAQEKFAMLPVALLTSRGAERHRRHAEVLGADAYLVKPCPDDELVATVRRLVERS